MSALLSVCLLSLHCVLAAPARAPFEKFPELDVRMLTKQEDKLPDLVRGKVALLVLAFQRDSQPKAEAWVAPFEATFSAAADVVAFEVPMLANGLKILRPLIEGGMRRKVPEARHLRFATYFGPLDDYVTILGIGDRELPWVYLLDKQGNIRWSAGALATPALCDEVARAAAALR